MNDVSSAYPFAWRHPLVYGLGVSGRAAAELLRSQSLEVSTYDDRPADGDAADDFARIEGDRLPDHVDAVVLSPGVPPDRPLLQQARSRSLPILSEIEIAFQLLDGPVLAITGSNGKSTTTALLGALLQSCGYAAEVCGNIGEPLSSCVRGEPGRVFVVELSSFQLEATDTFRPSVAAFLNLSPDHLDRYESFEGYGAAKQRIFRKQGEGDVAVVNADDAAVMALAPPPPVRTRTFSRLGPVEDGCYVEQGQIMEAVPGKSPEILFRVEDLGLEGEHNLENALAATLSARSFGTTGPGLSDALESFVGLPHRLQRLGERRGVRFYDDSKGTNIAATSSSLAGFDDASVHLILGGRNKDADLRDLRAIVRLKAAAVYLIGETANELESVLSDVVACRNVGTLDVAVAAAASAATAGQSVVLSPACASFDQFANFVERGRVFQQLVHSRLGGSC